MSKMTANSELRFSVYWMNNEEWYSVDYERNRLVLTDKATPLARESFEKWKEINHLDWD